LGANTRSLDFGLGFGQTLGVGVRRHQPKQEKPMTKKSTKFSVALSQTAKPKRKGAKSKLDTVRAQLVTESEWQLFREALVNTDIPVQAIQEALAITGIKVSLPTVYRWRKDELAYNRLVWAQVDRDMALTEVAQLRGDN
jgi:hypothetical protein